VGSVIKLSGETREQVWCGE